ncbi:MAG: TatD family hydrolase [Verrucomicrobia bacterium]|nr:TatD family hydrolase [Verrucomicrobiota bacterium]MBI3869575.1 TatD family hydrolase [Verrucomicrobiota bacterium]
MIPIFYDTHAHLDFPDYAPDLDEVLARAQNAGISRILSIGTDLSSSRQAVALAERHSFIHAVIGWHPNHVMEAPDDVRPELRDLARHPKVAAVGETGMDYYRMPSQQTGGTAAQDEAFKRKQAQVFEQQLEVAANCGLNVVIHQRAAWEDTIQRVRAWSGKVRTVFHCFSESPEAMRQVLDLDGLVSFTGILTFKNGKNIRDTLAATPLERFMLETDCPYLAPAPYRGKRCEPAYVKEIAATAAEVKGVSLEALSAATCSTAEAFFRMRA